MKLSEMRKSGLAFHVHHDKLVDYCYDYNGRVEAIKSVKPENETPTRLRLFQLLPESVSLPEDVQNARAELDNARAELGNARAEVDKAGAEWKKADAEWNKAMSRNLDFFGDLHAELCPCKEWDGKQIVFP